jgi:hypothetical protein
VAKSPSKTFGLANVAFSVTPDPENPGICGNKVEQADNEKSRIFADF